MKINHPYPQIPKVLADKGFLKQMLWQSVIRMEHLHFQI